MKTPLPTEKKKHGQRLNGALFWLLVLACAGPAFTGVGAPLPETSFHSAAVPDSVVTDRRVDFEVQSISKRRFRISFNNRGGSSVFVKIYDVIGNLIRHEKIDRKGRFRKEYNLSEARTNFYVIEVGNEVFSTTKRLFPG
ncbi:MAG: hypothetical protein H7Z75_09870 [Ferruginibacter sp.]|nr:hypothetical protein [Cytophagales bacterium]